MGALRHRQEHIEDLPAKQEGVEQSIVTNDSFNKKHLPEPKLFHQALSSFTPRPTITEKRRTRESITSRFGANVEAVVS